MQEKWVYDKGTFNGFAKHWQTGKAVPPALFEAIKASRTYRKGEE
jgi:Zn-dependent oligopeptidase